MTMPNDVAHASRLFQDWLVELRDRAMLGSHHASYAMLRAVLHELRDRMQTERALRLADVLPPLVRGIMLEGWHPASDVSPASKPFLDAVKERLEPHHPPPDDIVDAVMKVLAGHTPPHRLSDLTALMPADAQPQWRAALAARPAAAS